MDKIICIGSACKDIFFPTSEGEVVETPNDMLAQKKIIFELGAKYKIEERAEALGGCAANVAVGMSRLGIETACYSHIGDDENSKWIKKQLEKNGVDIGLIKSEKNYPGDLSAIVIDKKSGDRVIFSNQKVNAKLEIDEDELKEANWFFIGDLHGEWEEKIDRICEIAKKYGIKIANNPRQANLHDNPKKILEIIPKSDIIFLNKDEAIELIMVSGKKCSSDELSDEKYLLKQFKGMGPEIVSITDGVRGAWATDGKEMVFAPGIKVEAKDTTGAGDAFISAFLAAYLKDKDLAECVRWGIAQSSHEVQFYGSIDGLLGEGAISEKAEKIKMEKI
jgi:sugar/nucleoside kinase (ribokinase family)